MKHRMSTAAERGVARSGRRMTKGGRATWWVVLSLVSASCGTPTGIEGPVLQTGQPSYEVQSEGGQLGFDLDYRITNPTDRSFYVVNCRGYFELELQRWDGSGWITAWSPFLPDCLSAPIVIGPGETFEGSVPVWASPFGSRTGPQFDQEDPGGTYRLVVSALLSSYQDRLPFGPQLPEGQRTSNSFEVSMR